MKLNKSHECLNCHEQIGDSNFCPHCGQQNTDKKLPVKQIMHDVLGDVLTFDSKFFKSLIPLLIKPGYLTNEYLSGKRVSFIFPFRLYLFITFLFFFVITVNTMIDKNYLADSENEAVKIDSTESISEIEKDSLINIIDTYSIYLPDKASNRIKARIDSAYQTGNDSTKTAKKNFEVNLWEKSDNDFFNYFQKKAEYLSNREDGDQIFWKELINQIPKVMFILLPVFALILKLLYFRRKIYYIEHLIFSLHFHTYVFINLMLAVFFPYWYVILFVLLSIHINLFLSLRQVYEQSRIKTFLKMGLLMGTYSFLMIPAFVLLVLLAVVSV